MITVIVGPQLAADFEEPTTAEWGFGQIEAGVSVGDPKFGLQGAHVDYTAGATRARWTRTQLSSANSCHRFLLGVWMKHDALPDWDALSQPALIAVADTSVNDFVAVRMAGSGGGLILRSGMTAEALTAPPLDWEWWEIRGCLMDGAWLFELRRDGADAAQINSAYTEPVKITSVGVGTSATAGGTDVVDFHADRMWWWAGGASDTCPEWWSSTPGLDGEPPATRVTGASVGPESYRGSLGALNSEGALVHILAGDANTIPVAITANVALDLQSVQIGLAPRGSAPLTFDTATWIGAAATTRVANLAVGPLETIDPVADIYEVWVIIDTDQPFLVDGEVIVT